MSAETPLTRPDSFGSELRGSRENAGLTLDQIITETKISRRILEALESGRFHLLPERVFSRNFVAQYAGIVGTDPDEMMALFDTAWQRFLDQSGSHPPALVVTDPSLASPVRWRFWIPITLGVFILAAVGLLIVKDRIRDGKPAGDQTRWEATRDLGGHQPGPPTPATRPTQGTLPHLAEPAGTEIDDTVDLSLTVAGGSECWIHYRDGEGRTGQQLLARGQNLQMKLVGPISLTLGNAAAVTLRVGGVEYRELGLPGQVLHTEVSRDGVVRLGGGQTSE